MYMCAAKMVQDDQLLVSDIKFIKFITTITQSTKKTERSDK